METYDPLKAPDPVSWLETDEGERLILVLDYHSEAGDELPNEELHASLHVAVENQAAMGQETPVQATIARLMQEGLDRHDAVHAVASVLAEHMHDLMHGGNVGADPNERYFKRLNELTAAQWIEDYGSPSSG